MNNQESEHILHSELGALSNPARARGLTVKLLNMIRQPNTARTGHGFTQAWIDAVWSKGTAVPGYNADVYRKDACGAWMQKQSYGTTSDFGWEIDHIIPVALGGSDDSQNLQPLFWKNNRHKSDSYSNWTCAVRAA